MAIIKKDTLSKITRYIIKVIKYVFFGIIGLAVLSFLAAEYTSRPKFCVSCHIMQPYFASWQESQHKNIACVECHIPPGVTHEIRAKYQALGMVAKYFTQTYGSKPWAEVSDAACLREGCHQTRLLKGKVQAKLGDVTVNFDHTPHLTQIRRGLKLRCTSCHSQIVQGKHIAVTETTCFLCHFKGMQHNQSISGCPSCHNAPNKVIEFQGIRFDHKEAVSRGIACARCHIDVVVGDGAVPKQRCFTCHNETWKLDRYSDVDFLHDNHVTKRTIACSNCHVDIQHKINKMSASISINCQTCHPNHHVAQKEMYMGIGGKGILEKRVDPMFQAQVSCAGCHIIPSGDEVTNETMKAGPKSCISCHGPLYGDILNGWRTRLTQLISQIKPVLEKSKQEVSRNKQAKALIAEAEYNVRFVEYGRGNHNIRYAQELLQTAEKQIQQALKIAKSKYKPNLVLIKPPAATKECYSCHIGIENIKVRFDDMPVPHGLHLEKAKLACLHCHKNTPKKHGMLIIQKSDCKACHHAQKEANCAACHPLENNLFKGLVKVDDIQATPSVMAENVPCEGCHTDLSKGSTLPKIKEACVGCHDKNYADLVDGWQQNTIDGIKELDKLYVPVSNVKWKGPENQQLMKEVNEIMNVLKSDKTKGAHNMEFDDTLITEAKKRLAMLTKALPKTTKK